MSTPAEGLNPVLQALGLTGSNSGLSGGHAAHGSEVQSRNPASGEALATVNQASPADVKAMIACAQAAFPAWREVPAPVRGEMVRQIGDALRARKSVLGELIALEAGKLLSEGLGEVQELIDVCDFAVGLSRQLYGLSMHSERPLHRMLEQWHPLGPVAVISAFNFPVAVWGWNAMIAAVCGNSIVWKPSPKTPLCAVAVQGIVDSVMARNGHPGVFNLVCGDEDIGRLLVADAGIPLVSFTGSTRAGREVAAEVARRLGRSLLELGGNNGLIVLDDADLDLALRAITFGVVGTAGQRCTSTRRLFLQAGVAATLSTRLVRTFQSLRIGNPLDPQVLVGPLIDEPAVERFEQAVAQALSQGGQLLCGGKRLPGPGHFVEPTLIRVPEPLPICREETFAPLCYVQVVDSLDTALEWHNAVPQGLSSALFTRDLLAAEQFLSAAGSDCGIANVNLGTSGAEIGGAFGGEKDTGGGRESGSDSWKAYMRRQTCTINYGRDLPLAQGVEFPIG